MTLELAIIIPALNESATIERVVRGVSVYGRAIVVDDGSTDDTGRLAQDAGAVVVTHEKNRGYEVALESGVHRAHELGYSYAITLDADGQLEPTLVARFLEALRGGADLVVGRRDHFQRFSEHVFSWVGRLLWRLDDPLCGLKGYRLSCLAVAGPFRSYPSIGTEFAVRLVRLRHRFEQFDIHTLPRAGASRFGQGLKGNYRILKGLWHVLVRR